MKRGIQNQFLGIGTWLLIGLLVTIGIFSMVTTAVLQSIDKCPDALKDERAQDYIDYLTAEEPYKSQLLNQLNKKYCEWAVAGNCYQYDASECSKYGISSPELFLTSRTEYILGPDAPGVLILFGSWKNESGEDILVPFTDIDIRIYEEGTQNIRTHKTIQTGENGFAFLEWQWTDHWNDWDKNWVLEFSSGDYTGDTSFFSEVADIGNYTLESDILNEYPDNVLYRIT